MVQQKRDLLYEIFGELRKVQDNTRSLIVITNSFLELLATTLTQHKTRNAKTILNDTRTYSYAVQLTILNELGLLDNTTYKLLNRFRKLRNKAAHDASFEIMTADANFIERNLAPVKKYFLDLPQIAGFVYTCQRVIMVAWNRHATLFQKYLSGN